MNKISQLPILNLSREQVTQGLNDIGCSKSIKLDKNHIPIHPRVTGIKKQVDYDFHISILKYLYNQIELGFEPAWLITYHYFHPVELSKPLKETNKPLGYGDRYSFKSHNDIFKSIPYYRYLERRRNNIEDIYQDTSQAKNCILKQLYGIKRLDRTDKYEFPNIFFFHEKGKLKLQYHTHILLPKKNLIYNNEAELKEVFNTTIRKSRKCFSTWKDIDVAPVTNKYGILSYLNKETNSNHISLDPHNSVPIQYE